MSAKRNESEDATTSIHNAPHDLIRERLVFLSLALRTACLLSLLVDGDNFGLCPVRLRNICFYRLRNICFQQLGQWDREGVGGGERDWLPDEVRTHVKCASGGVVVRRLS